MRNFGSAYGASFIKGKKTGAASQKFTNRTDSDELLRAVTFGSTYSGYDYDVYVSVGDGKPDLLKSGYQNYAGIHTVRLDRGVIIPAGSEFTVYVSLTLKSPVKNSVGLFYCTNWARDLRSEVGDTAAYYGDEPGDFSNPHYSAEKGDFPIIRALTYSGAVERDTSLISLADFFDFNKSGETWEVTQKRDAEIQYEEGVTPIALENGSFFEQNKADSEGRTGPVR